LVFDTTTLKEQKLIPQAFVALQVTLVEPAAKTLPLAGLQLSSAPLTITGFGKYTATLDPLMSMVMDDGQVMTGGSQGAARASDKLARQAMLHRKRSQSGHAIG